MNIHTTFQAPLTDKDLVEISVGDVIEDKNGWSYVVKPFGVAEIILKKGFVAIDAKGGAA